MRKVIFISALWAVMLAPAMADMAGNVVYYHSGSALYSIPDVTNTSGSGFVGDYFIGNFGVQMTDIAFNTDGTLYGVSTSNLYTIDPTTAATTWAQSNPVSGMNALGNFGSGQFYAAQYNNGYFYTLDLNVSPSWTYNGQYADSTGAYQSSGDIWVTGGGTVYATIRRGSNGYLATVNPTNAMVTIVAPISGSVPADLYGLIENGAGDLLVLRENKDVLRLEGNTLVDTGINTLGTVYGSTAIVPVPGAVLLGILGLGAVGVKVRKYA